MWHNYSEGRIPGPPACGDPSFILYDAGTGFPSACIPGDFAAMDNTLNYYAQNADQFVSSTRDADMRPHRERFLRLLPPGAHILDFGCGSGRDTKAFLDRGYVVTAVDGSEQLCALASAYTGIPIRRMLFRDLDDVDCYDGIWASASLLHVPFNDLPAIFRRMITALKPGGIIYSSFKYGSFEGNRGGRYFTDLTEEKSAELLRGLPELTLLDQWITNDVRPSRSDERWLNLICRGPQA